jgi:hypothetical protein
METRSKTGAQPPASADRFYQLAWPTILNHYNNVTQTNPMAVALSRDESTYVRLTTTSGQTVDGRLRDNLHAENNAYNQVWYKFLQQAEDLAKTDTRWKGQEYHAAQQLFDSAVRGKTQVRCIVYDKSGNVIDTHKESCFMCSAIAHCLGVSVEKKDLSGYAQYDLPDIFKYSLTHLQQLVGDEAYAEFKRLSGGNQSLALTGLGGALYAAHKGSGGMFKTS